MSTISSAQTGLWSETATWTDGVVPVLGDKVNIASGHTVTVDGTYSCGDDTSTALNITGTLKASRTASSELTVRGTVVFVAAAGFDYGSEADPIPSDITAAIYYNDASSPSIGKYTFGAGVSMASFKIWGATKQHITQITAATVVDATSFEVADATGWLVGDIVVVGPAATTSPTTAGQPRAITAITAGSGTAATVTLGAALSEASAAGRYVANLSRNVKIAPLSYGSTCYLPSSTVTGGAEVGYCEILGNGWGTGSAAQTTGCYVTTSRWRASKGVSCHNVRSVSGSTPTYISSGTSTGASAVVSGTATTKLEDWLCYVYSVSTGTRGIVCALSSSFNLVSPVLIAFSIPFGTAGNTTGAFGGTIESPLLLGGSSTQATAGLYTTQSTLTLSTTINNGTFVAWQRLIGSTATIGIGSLTFDSCDFGSTNGSTTQAKSIVVAATALDVLFKDCDFPPQTAVERASASLTTMNASSQIIFQNKNHLRANQERYTHGGQQVRENSVTKRGLSSIRFDCWHAANPLTYSFTASADAGETLVFRGSMQYTSTYGTTYPPSVTVSGLGITALTATCPTTGGDAWHDFEISVTNPNDYSGDFTVTLTGQSAADSVGAYCYFDGLNIAPWVDDTRHFGYQFDSNAYRTADALITLTQTEALALAVAVDHTAQTITVSAALTNAEVYQACIADLCKTANLAVAVHITSTDGSDFTTTYTLVFDSAGAISGAYTDAQGRIVTVTAANLILGSRVQLYDVAAGTELLNTVLAEAGLSTAASWTANKTIRLRAEHATKLPLETLGLLTSAGLSFLDEPDDDEVYSTNGIDGSTCNEFAADGANIQIDISDSDGETNVQRLYAWLQWYQTTQEGVASDFFGAMTATDSANYEIDQGLADIKLDNVSSTPVVFSGGYLVRADGTTVIASSSGSIQIDPGRAYLASGASSATTTAEAVWAHGSRTLTEYTLESGERIVVMNASGQMLAR